MPPRIAVLRHGLWVPRMFAAMLWLLVAPVMASKPCDTDAEADESSVVQIRLDQWRAEAPPGVTLVVEGGGGMACNSFPALSTDGSEIALLYFAGHPLEQGYPRFEIHSTATLELQERIELFSEQEQRQVIERTGRFPDLHDPQLLRRIEGHLDEINARLRKGGFRPMDTLFNLLEHNHRLDGVEKFGKRMDYPSSATSRALSITSLSTGQVELDMELPSGVEPYGPEGQCSWGGTPWEAWYEPELRVVVLRVTFMDAIHGCERPEQWFLKRLGDP